MDDMFKITQFLWDLISKNKNTVVNITKIEEEIVISIMTGRHWKRFQNANSDLLIKDITQALAVY